MFEKRLYVIKPAIKPEKCPIMIVLCGLYKINYNASISHRDIL